MVKVWLKGLVAATLLSGLVFSVTTVPEWRQDTPRQENYEGLANGLFNEWLVPFEVLSILLLGALIGALYISQKWRNDDEEEDDAA